MEIINDALLLKNLHNFFNKEDLPWVHLFWDQYYNNGQLPGLRKKRSFWWRDIVKLRTTYKGIAKVQLQNDLSIHFWNDLWNRQLLS